MRMLETGSRPSARTRRWVALAGVTALLTACDKRPTEPAFDEATTRPAGTLTIVSGADQRVGPGEVQTVAPIVRVLSDRGKPLRGAVLALSVDAGILASTSVTTDMKGEVALPRWQAPVAAGVARLTVRSTPSPGSTTPSTAVTAQVSLTVVDAQVTLTTQSVGSAGGTIAVSSTTSPLSGLSIVVPRGALASNASFTIQSRPAPVVPAGFTYVSPVIDIGNGGIVTDSLVQIRIPARAVRGGRRTVFALNAGNRLIPIATTSSDSISVTIGVNDFSVPSFNTSRLTEPVSAVSAPSFLTLLVLETLLPTSGVVSVGFGVGSDNVGFVNYGSFWNSGGYCAGSTALSGAYFLSRLGGTATLPTRTRFTTLLQPAETGNWSLTDQLNPAIRLASALQSRYQTTGNILGFLGLFFALVQSPQAVWESSVAQLLFSTVPVFMVIQTADGREGHAVLAYKADIDQGRLFVVDPNYPDDLTRFIQYRASTRTFDPFAASPNANSTNGTSYTRFTDATYFFQGDAQGTIAGIMSDYASTGLRSQYVPAQGRVRLHSNTIVSTDGDTTRIQVQSRDRTLRWVAANVPSGAVSYLTSWTTNGAIQRSTNSFQIRSATDTLRVPLATGENKIGMVVFRTVGSASAWYDAKLLIVTRAAPALAFVSHPGSAAPGGIVPNVRAGIVDEDRVLVPEQRPVTVTLAGGTPGAVLSGTVSTSSADGSIDFSTLSVDRAGTGYTLTLSSPGLPSVTSAPFDVSAPIGIGVLTGRVYNALTNASVAGAVIDLRTVSGGLLSRTTTNAAGAWTFAGLAAGTYRVDAVATGFVPSSITSQQLTPPSTIAEPIPLVPTATPGGISGTVRNASTTLPVSGSTTVELRNGINSTTGTTLATQLTTNGAFAFTNIPAGVYTVVARNSAFADGSRTGIVVGAGSVTTNQDVLLSTNVTGVARVVLSWGATPSDLDSHMTGPLAGASNRFWAYFNSRGSCTVSPFACLDVDDVTSFGPETITLSRLTSGVYRYYVYDYSNRDATTSSALSLSGAKVEFYLGNALQRTFFVPSGVGNAWAVFEWDGQTVTTVNRMYNVSGVPQPPIRTDGSAGPETMEEEMRRLLLSQPTKKGAPNP